MALGARVYERQVDVVLEAVDPEAPSGRVRVRLEGGPDGAAVRPTSDPPDLTLMSPPWARRTSAAAAFATRSWRPASTSTAADPWPRPTRRSARPTSRGVRRSSDAGEAGLPDPGNVTGPRPASILRLPEFRALLAGRFANAIGMTALATVVAFQTYEVTGQPSRWACSASWKRSQRSG